MGVAELGKGSFYKPLDEDMCAAMLEAEEKSFTSKIYPTSNSPCSNSVAEAAEALNTN